MSRRHHHPLQPYDYDRFIAHARDREPARAMEYQDDSMSSINSDEDSYLHHQHRDKKSNFYNPKTESGSKSIKLEKPSNSESCHPKEMLKSQYTAPSSNPDPTSSRLSRLETMMEQIIKRNPPSKPVVETVITAKDKAMSEKRGQISLESRKHTFTTSMWINKIQDASIQNNWDEKTTISYMGSQMSGIIKAWYINLPSYGYTWPEWKILISKMFPDNTDFVTSLKRLVTRLKKAKESLITYYFSKMYLLECCKITGEDAVSCLIDGLNNQTIQAQAKARNFPTPETFYSQFLAVLSEYVVDYPPAAASVKVAPKVEVAIPHEPMHREKPPQKEVDFRPLKQFHDHKPPLQARQVPVVKRLDKRLTPPKQFKSRVRRRSRSRSRSDSRKSAIQPSAAAFKRDCDCCHLDHFIVFCSEFRCMTSRERLERVERKRLCRNCLGRHNALDCTNKGVCKLCRETHHTMLHDAYKIFSKSSAHSSSSSR